MLAFDFSWKHYTWKKNSDTEKEKITNMFTLVVTLWFNVTSITLEVERPIYLQGHDTIVNDTCSPPSGYEIRI